MALSTEASLMAVVQSPGGRGIDCDDFGRHKLPSICWTSSLSYFRGPKKKGHLNPGVKDQPQKLKNKKYSLPKGEPY